LAILDRIDDVALDRFQPAWATRAHLLVGLGDRRGASDAYGRALELTTDDGVRRFLLTRLREARAD
jgi:predicted RNA polymerase sigma factor